MFRKLFTLIAFVLGTSLIILAQDVKYVRMFYKEIKLENSDYDISISDVLSTAAETKFKFKITNKTKDFILFKPNECKVIIEGKEYSPSEKELIIDPYESGFRVINTKGAGFNAIKNYSFEINGIYKFASSEKIAKVNDFKLPPSQNDFEADNFSCTMKDLKKESGETWVKFECRYNGDNMGIISTNKPSVLMPDGNSYATEKTKDKFVILKKGDAKSFSMKWSKMEGGSKMDMQKVEMILKWNETFSESKINPIKGAKVEIEWDEALTNLKGK